MLKSIVFGELTREAKYIQFDTIKRELTAKKNLLRQGQQFKVSTLRSYLSSFVAQGKLFDAGKGWYSTLSEPLHLQTEPVQQIAALLVKSFPLLNVSCWSTEQINPFMHHLLARHVVFVYTERDALQTVFETLNERLKARILNNPGKKDVEKHLDLSDNPVILRPLLTTEPKSKNGIASPEKILVDLLNENDNLNLMEPLGAEDVAYKAIHSGRVQMSHLINYAKARYINEIIVSNITSQHYSKKLR